MKEVIQKMIVETDGQLKQAIITERFAQRKVYDKKDVAEWEKMRDQMQAQIESKKELIAFLEEVAPEYEKE